MNPGELIVFTVFLGFVGICVYLFFFKVSKVNDQKATTTTEKASQKKNAPKSGKIKSKSAAPKKSGGGKGKGKGKGKAKKKKQSAIAKLATRIKDVHTRVTSKSPIDFSSSPNLFTALRGHLGVITSVAFSPHSTQHHPYLFVASEDGFVTAWTNFEEGRSLATGYGRVSIAENGDGFPTALTTSRDGHYVVVATSGNPDRRRRGKIVFFRFLNKTKLKKLQQETDEKEPPCPLIHEHEFESLSTDHVDFLEVEGSFILTGSRDNSDDIFLYKMKGSKLCEEPVNQLQNCDVRLSHDGNLICVASFARHAILYEVRRNKTSQTFEQLERLALFGHSRNSDIHHSAPLAAVLFSEDDDVVISVGQDGVIGVWNINVNYAREEHPQLLKQAHLPGSDVGPVIRAELCSPKQLLALVTATEVVFYSLEHEEFFARLDNLSLDQDGSVTSVVFGPEGEFVAVGGTDSDVRVYRTPQR